MKYIKQLGWVLLLVPGLFAFYKQDNTVKNNSLFWEISGNGISKPSYLFGTIHMIGENDFFLPEIVKEKFSTCKVLATEVDLNLTMQEKIDMALKTLLPDNKTIEDYMNPEDFQELRKYMIDEVGIKEKKVDKYVRMKPFFLSSVILTEQLGKVKSYEEEFMNMAKKNKMQTMGLESVDYQFDVVDGISIEEQIKLLKAGIEEGENGINQFDGMTQLYKEQKLDELYNMTVSESDDIPNFKTSFLDTRNANWIPIIEKSAKEKPVFIAVGAGHLAGEKGVIALLKEKGYTVQPMKK